jgi:hypothetical protein
LYLLLMRDDDDFADLWETELLDWQSDRDEIYLDVNVDTLNDGRGASDDQTGASYGHYQFTSIWVQDAEEWTGSPTQWYHNAPFQFGYVRTGDSYYSEYRWPFTSLTISTTLLPTADATFQAAEGVTFGLEVVISDVDMSDNPTDETFRKFIRWIGVSGWATMDSAGQVQLGGSVNAINDFDNSAGITVYPSPASDYIKLHNLTSNVDIEVYDMLGHLIMVRNDVSSQTSIGISALKQGMYILVADKNKMLRFIKE